MKAQHLSSQVLPRIVAAAYRYSYFPTTRGWAEMKRQDACRRSLVWKAQTRSSS